NLSGSAITTVAAGGLGLTVISGDGDGTNAVVLGQVGSLTNPLKFLTIQRTSATARTLLAGNIFTDNNVGTGAVQTPGTTANVVLGNSTPTNPDALGSGTGGAVNFTTPPITAAPLSGQGLTITAGNGAVTLNTVGNLGIGLGFLSVTTTGLTTLNGNITTDPLPLSGNIDFSGATGGISLGNTITINSDGDLGGTGRTRRPTAP